MAKLSRDSWDNDVDSGDLDRPAGPRRRARRSSSGERGGPAPDSQKRGPTRKSLDGREAFKCLHCRAFIGAPISGGRHRNHCPLCLFSRHVDAKRPGDRASNCRSLMAPVARFDRRDGEPVLVHRCLGCGRQRHNRLAADDNVLALVRLPLEQPSPPAAVTTERAAGRRAS